MGERACEETHAHISRSKELKRAELTVGDMTTCVDMRSTISSTTASTAAVTATRTQSANGKFENETKLRKTEVGRERFLLRTIRICRCGLFY
uniref:Uncharacterized protein n=1 Tax=Pristionchus pacificus TaxID=54126 RepID=A0A2A6BKR0_PRIPA|eukprot:PDM66489.1 hypothetical protein PRIPAC_47906 [Pristionchus pacificus]